MDNDYEDYKVMEYMHKGYSYLEAKEKLKEDEEKRIELDCLAEDRAWNDFIYETDVFDD